MLIRGTKGSRRVLLTDEGMILAQARRGDPHPRAQDGGGSACSDEAIVGEVGIGSGETDIVRLFARAAQAIRRRHPDIRYRISSGNAEFVLENLDKGLIDFGLLFGAVDEKALRRAALPARDRWGVLMRRDAPLAQKEAVCPEDLWDKPLIVSHQRGDDNSLSAGSDDASFPGST